MNQTSDTPKPAAAALVAAIEAALAAGDQPRLMQAYLNYLAHDPKAGWAWNDAGMAAWRMGERDAAIQCLTRALACPGYPAAHATHSNLSCVYLENDWPLALRHAREAVRLAPDFQAGWHSLGNTLIFGGHAAEAVLAFERAASLSDETYPAFALFQSKRQACRWDGLAELEARVVADSLAGRLDTPPFLAFTHAETTGAQQLAIAKRWAAVNFGEAPPRWSHQAAPDGRIRLGYISSDFAGHATTRLLVNTIENHDRSRFAVIGFSIGRPSADPEGARIIRAFDAVHDLFSLSDEAAAAAIRAQGVDILMDVDGYTFGSRTRILARRPAPLQVNYLAWPGTMGAPFIDYMIADRIVAPDPSAFSETLLYLDCYQPTDSARPVGPRPSRAELGLPEDAVVLASMNAPWKLTPKVLDVWADILRQAPGAVLWQLGAADCEAGLREEAARRGIADSRLIIAPGVDNPSHLARLSQADLALDPFPCGGHTTTSDLLWAGVPVVTLTGSSFCANVSASLLTAVGLPDLVCADAGRYVKTALTLIGDASRRAGLKAYLLGAGRRSRLFDNQRHVRELEATLLTIAPSALS